MDNYSDADRRLAGDIIESLFSQEHARLDLASNLAISDFEADVEDFADELAYLASIDQGIPVLPIDGELIPVALRMLAGDQWFLMGLPDRSEFMERFFPPWRRRPRFPYVPPFDRGYVSQEDIQVVSLDEGRTTFARKATEFLATRIAAVREFPRWRNLADSPRLKMPQRLGGSSVSTPGCNFTVTTNSTGLRVFWSGAYRLASNYFGHPTTPVSATLQSGTYVFGVDGGAYGHTIRWDRNAVVSLPGPPTAHLNY